MANKKMKDLTKAEYKKALEDIIAIVNPRSGFFLHEMPVMIKQVYYDLWQKKAVKSKNITLKRN